MVKNISSLLRYFGFAGGVSPTRAPSKENQSRSIELDGPECKVARLEEENDALRGVLRQMGFDVDALLSGPDSDHCRNVLLRHTSLDEKSLQEYAKSEAVMQKWREAWSSLRIR